MIQNGDGQIERMVEELTADMAEAAEVLSRRKISLAAALYLCNVVLLPQALYRLKLSHATSEQVDRVQAAVRRVVARKARLTAAHSDVLFGGYMGCGWRRWRDEVGIERIKIIAMAWEEWDTTFARVMRGAVAQMQEEHGRVPMVFQGAYVGGNERIAETWLGQAWRWMSQVRLTMKLRGVSAVVSEADPLICSAFNTADDRARSRAACARFRVRRRSDMMCYDGEQVRPEAAVGGEWERADGGKWAGWACAVRQRLVYEKMLPVAMPVPAVEVGVTLAFKDAAARRKQLLGMG